MALNLGLVVFLRLQDLFFCFFLSEQCWVEVPYKGKVMFLRLFILVLLVGYLTKLL